MMITLRELLKDAKEKSEQANKLRIAVAKEKAKEEVNESELWVTTPFKEKGLTNDKMRNAYVKQQMNLLYPSFYLQKKAELDNITSDLKWIYEMINVMKLFGVFELELDEKKATEENKE